MTELVIDRDAQTGAELRRRTRRFTAPMCNACGPGSDVDAAVWKAIK
jgi:hypothetical protein